MAENNDPPRQSQPFLDILKIINGLKQEPLSQRQQAELAKLHTHLQQDSAALNRLRDMLSMPPEEAERWKLRPALPSGLFDKIRKAYEQLQQEACEPSEPAPETVSAREPAPEPVIESAVNKTAEQVAPIKRKRPKQWVGEWRQSHPRRKGEGPGEYAQRMCDDMANAPDVTEAWTFENCRRELYRKPKEVDFEPTPGSVQTFPRHH
jgi:hypothetical protein